MKLSKGQGMSLFSAFILFGIFNVVVFLAPLAHTVVFWLGYFFALFAARQRRLMSDVIHAAAGATTVL